MRSGLPLRLIQHQVFPSQHTRLIPQLCWQLLSRRKCILDPLFSLPNGMFLLLLALLVDVFAAFSSLAAELRERSAYAQGLTSRTYHDGVGWRASNHHHLAKAQPPIPALKSRKSRDHAQLLGGRACLGPIRHPTRRSGWLISSSPGQFATFSLNARHSSWHHESGTHISAKYALASWIELLLNSSQESTHPKGAMTLRARI